jgi:hypothetical protein
MTKMTITIEYASDQTTWELREHSSKKSNSMERGTLNLLGTVLKVFMDKWCMAAENEGASLVSTISPEHEQVLSDAGVTITVDREKFYRAIGGPLP